MAFLTVAYFVGVYYLIVLGYDWMSYPYGMILASIVSILASIALFTRVIVHQRHRSQGMLTHPSKN